MSFNQYNLFVYCNNNPIANYDSSGMCDAVAITAIAIMALCSAYLVANMSMSAMHDENLQKAIAEVNELITSSVEDFTVRDQNVYFLYNEKEGEIAYIGRTNCIDVRKKAHKRDPKRTDYIMLEDATIRNLTKAEARALEQILMMSNYTYRTTKKGCNAINGISPSNPNLYLYFASILVNENIEYTQNQIDEFIYNLVEGNM